MFPTESSAQAPTVGWTSTSHGMESAELELELDSAVLPAVNRMHLIWCVSVSEIEFAIHARTHPLHLRHGQKYPLLRIYRVCEITWDTFKTPCSEYLLCRIIIQTKISCCGEAQPPCLRNNIKENKTMLIHGCQCHGNAVDKHFLSIPKFYIPATVLSLITASKSRLQLPQ